MINFENMLARAMMEAEINRQNFMDALEEIRELRKQIKALEFENEMLEHQLELAENHIMHAGN